MSDLAQVAVGSFFGAMTFRIVAALWFDALLARRIGGR